VKTRGEFAFCSPEEAVTPAKQRQIHRIAEAYLFHQSLEDIKCRFDVLAILFDLGTGSYRIRHYRDAFD
jgi:Holliday junction resolvase-like predicted endonuclease